MNRVTKLIVGALALAAAAVSQAASAQQNTVTCTGTLIDVAIKPRGWPLAVIYDVDGGYTCSVDRSSAGHDPLRPCSVGEKCRLVGTYKKIGQTYSIQRLISIE